MRYDVLIVGAGHGGSQLAAALVAGGYEGTVGLVSDDVAAPYERPPLTKGYLAGGVLSADLAFRSEDWWAASGIERMLGSRVVSVDSEAHTVGLEDGGFIGYGTLVWAAGGEARRLTVPGADLRGVHVIRTLADAEHVKRSLGGARRAVIVGGGYIGLEAAASLRLKGVEVTVVETLDRLLMRVTGDEISGYIHARHAREGVNVLLGETVTEMVGANGQVTDVRLASGRVLEADLVIVGIGLVPNVGPLEQAGAEVGNGVHVDDYCRTTLHDVYALGDCASFVSEFAASQRIRLESVQNANDQAKLVASAILGDPEAYGAVPWFWSHQYDDRLQTVGVLAGYDETVVRGDATSGKFSVVYLRGGAVAAVDCVNNVRDYAQAKGIIGRTAPADRARLADPAEPFKAIFASSALGPRSSELAADRVAQ